MRPLVCLASLLPALTAPPAAFGSESDLESLQRKLAREVQQRIDAGMRTALVASVSAHAPARPTRMTLYYLGTEIGAPALSILRKASRDDAVIVAQSFSKAYCMTGWRIGWLVARRDVGQKAIQLNEFIISHPASFIQRAAQTALAQGEEELRKMVARLRENRDSCLAALRPMPGVTVPSPDGAFYLFPKIEGLTDSFAFCRKLLEETHVGLAPGVAFGAGGEGSVRICYAAEQGILEQAMERLAHFLSQHQPLTSP